MIILTIRFEGLDLTRSVTGVTLVNILLAKTRLPVKLVPAQFHRALKCPTA
jgi:hypothetical protein